jgi:predicted transcriptional regulator
VFGGAANPLLVHFVKRANLTPDEVRELQKILSEKGSA